MTTPPFDDIKNFMNAAWDGDTDGMNAFLAKYPDAQEITKGEPIGFTALMWAAQSDKPSSIELLLARGAKIDARDMNGETSLMLAAGRGNFATVHMLIDKGADVLATDNGGRTAADHAKGKLATFSYLETVIQQRRKTEEEAAAQAARVARETLEQAQTALQNQMRANLKSGKFRLGRRSPWG